MRIIIKKKVAGTARAVFNAIIGGKQVIYDKEIYIIII